MTQCPGNHQSCPAPPTPGCHLHTTSWGWPPRDPLDPLKQKQECVARKQSLGHPQVMESALHLPGLGASSCPLLTPDLPPQQDGTGKVGFSPRWGWEFRSGSLSSLLAVPRGAGLVQNILLLSLPLGPRVRLGHSGIQPGSVHTVSSSRAGAGPSTQHSAQHRVGA